MIFLFVLPVVLWTCLVCNVQQSYAGEETAKLLERVTTLEDALEKSLNESAALRTEVVALKEKAAAKQCTSGRLIFPPLTQTTETRRTEVRHVRFNNPFSMKPMVMAAFTLLASSEDRKLRVHTWASNVTTTGFDFNVREWSYTYNYNVIVAWMAC